jgi:hypothetical protein
MENSGHKHIVVQRDTGAWRMQVWISFGIAVLVCGAGLALAAGRTDLDRAFMVMGYFFCLSAAFVLAKYVRDQRHRAFSDTPLVVRWWSGAASPCPWRSPAGALWRMEINPTWKSYLLVSWLYLISTRPSRWPRPCATAYEADRLERGQNVDCRASHSASKRSRRLLRKRQCTLPIDAHYQSLSSTIRRTLMKHCGTSRRRLARPASALAASFPSQP